MLQRLLPYAISIAAGFVAAAIWPQPFLWIALGALIGYGVGREVSFHRWKRTGQLP